MNKEKKLVLTSSPATGMWEETTLILRYGVRKKFTHLVFLFFFFFNIKTALLPSIQNGHKMISLNVHRLSNLANLVTPRFGNVFFSFLSNIRITNKHRRQKALALPEDRRCVRRYAPKLRSRSDKVKLDRLSPVSRVSEPRACYSVDSGGRFSPMAEEKNDFRQPRLTRSSMLGEELVSAW